MRALLERLRWDNRAIASLPLDPVTDNYVRTVPRACFSLVSPTPLKGPALVAHSQAALSLLGVEPEAWTAAVADPEFVEYFGGNKVMPGARPAAHCYCGHQFGYFSGQLGDGATMYLGELMNTRGERWELQFKGAGLTPYSRTADGRKVLRSSLREYLASEAMQALGVPTTRAGTLVSSDSTVARDMYYSGHVVMERCAVITRIAPTFLRFGSFEIVKGRDAETGREGPSAGAVDILTTLTDFTIASYFPEIAAATTSPGQRYQEFFLEVTRRTARLVAQWQAVGFCHGVLNTDNMSIIGVTIDYGPYAFMDRFDPGFTCNGSDDGSRYSYEKQPEMCKWNCGKLGEMLEPLLPPGWDWRAAMAEQFDAAYSAEYSTRMAHKLGLEHGEVPGWDDAALVRDLLDAMASSGADFTNTWRVLAFVDAVEGSDSVDLTTLPDPANDDLVFQLLGSHLATLEELMKAVQPVQEATKEQLHMLMALAHQGRIRVRPGEIEKMLALHDKYDALAKLTGPQKVERDKNTWFHWLGRYRARLVAAWRLHHASTGVSLPAFLADRHRSMRAVNPSFVLRNCIAQAAIEEAEAGAFDRVQRLQAALEQPHRDNQEGYAAATLVSPAVGGGPSEESGPSADKLDVGGDRMPLPRAARGGGSGTCGGAGGSRGGGCRSGVAGLLEGDVAVNCAKPGLAAKAIIVTCSS